MVFHKQFQEEWQQYIQLSNIIVKDEEWLLIKDFSILLCSYVFIFVAGYAYYTFGNPEANKLNALPVISTIATLTCLWAWKTNNRLKSMRRQHPNYAQIKELEKKLNQCEAFIEGYDLMEKKIEGHHHIERFLIKCSEKKQADVEF